MDPRYNNEKDAVGAIMNTIQGGDLEAYKHALKTTVYLVSGAKYEDEPDPNALSFEHGKTRSVLISYTKEMHINEYEYAANFLVKAQKAGVPSDNELLEHLKWNYVCAQLNDSLEESKSSARSELNEMKKLLVQAKTKSTPSEKIKIIEDVLAQYRSILRSGATGLFGTSTGSVLAKNVATFFNKILGIQLPEKLDKGVELSLKTLVMDSNRKNLDHYIPGNKINSAAKVIGNEVELPRYQNQQKK